MNMYTWTVSSVNVTAPNSSDGSQLELFTTLGHSMYVCLLHLPVT
jgi:hypothetical protein